MCCEYSELRPRHIETAFKVDKHPHQRTLKCLTLSLNDTHADKIHMTHNSWHDVHTLTQPHAP